MKKLVSMLLLVVVSLSVVGAEVGITLNTRAVIPTFLSLNLEGLGTSHTHIGTGSSLFPAELFFGLENGLIDSNWVILDLDTPEEGVYVPSDVLKATITSNARYAYKVELSNLTMGTESLPIEMAYSLDNLTWIDSDLDSDILTDRGIRVVWHKFRVPYSLDYLAGEYTGTITFKAYTL